MNQTQSGVPINLVLSLDRSPELFNQNAVNIHKMTESIQVYPREPVKQLPDTPSCFPRAT
jgi:hypothetical protein